MTVQLLKDADFRKRVLEEDGPVLLAITARFCGASGQLLSAMEELAEGYRDSARWFNIDLGDNEAEALRNPVVQKYKVKRLPLVILFSEGQAKDYIGGVPSTEGLKEMVDRHTRPVRDVVGEEDFRREVLESKLPVLVQFYSAGCKMSLDLLGPVEKAAERVQGRAKVVRVEADAFNAPILARYGAVRLPLLATFDAGEMRDCIAGAVSDESLRSIDGGSVSAEDHITSMVEQLC